MNKIIALSISLLFSTIALAQDNEIPEPSADRMPAQTAFSILDANKDGHIDMNEAKADQALEKDFAKIAKQGKIDEKSFYDWKLKAPEKPAMKKE